MRTFEDLPNEMLMEIWKHLVDRPGEVGMLNDCANFARTCQINHRIGWPFLYKVDAQSPRPLAMAFGAANGRIATMEKALASGADVNQLTDGFQKMAETDDEDSFDEYAAPLHFAAKNDEYTAAEWLLSHGADWPTISGRHNDLISRPACSIPMPPMAYFREFSTSDRSGTFLSDKARLLRLLLARNKAENLFNINSYVAGQQTMLMYLVMGSRCISSPEMVRDLLSYGADPDWQCLQVDGGFTALHCAVRESVLYHDASKFRIARMQVTEYAESLLRLGPANRPASLAIEDAQGYTPLETLHSLASMYLKEFGAPSGELQADGLDFDLLSPYELNKLSADQPQRVKRAIMFIKVLSRVAHEEELITTDQFVDHLARASVYHEILADLEAAAAKEKLRLDKMKLIQIMVAGERSKRKQGAKTLKEELDELEKEGLAATTQKEKLRKSLAFLRLSEQRPGELAKSWDSWAFRGNMAETLGIPSYFDM
ncbi:hypothetical protein B0T18DRAFT_424783 [Schizothecium vesticola]|uniref:Ankyrin n=1 Tax=Schizothecium vesticola TaxID=314040 RepID=A0AA40FB57_9PEZI|nr:hypothetical protein B0T18DRAFT_424783 [Schizothecium vesticola]